jgi:ubiquitin-like protein Pup
MPDRIHRQSEPAPRAEDAVEAIPGASADGQLLRDEIDDLLDEIDDVLEENAEEFVKNYVQKGGQ